MNEIIQIYKIKLPKYLYRLITTPLKLSSFTYTSIDAIVIPPPFAHDHKKCYRQIH